MQGASLGATVLVVEDDADTRMVYSDGLGHSGYRVITAATGMDGLRAARDEHPDVILLDLSLRGADGWEVAGFTRFEIGRENGYRVILKRPY